MFYIKQRSEENMNQNIFDYFSCLARGREQVLFFKFIFRYFIQNFTNWNLTNTIFYLSGSLLLESKINPNTAYQKQQASSCLSLIWKTSSVIKEVLIWQRWESFPDKKNMFGKQSYTFYVFPYRSKVSNWESQSFCTGSNLLSLNWATVGLC